MYYVILLLLILFVLIILRLQTSIKKKDVDIKKEIDEDEILVRFIYDRNFKGKIVNKNNLITKELFLPYKEGVSLQRFNYCDENQCKAYAKRNIKGKVYSGFIIFKKTCFDKVQQLYKNDRVDFEAIVKSTPLDLNNEYLPDDVQVFIKSKGNPSHADIIYINPAAIGNETTKTAIRSFSRKFSKVCQVAIDEEISSIEYKGKPFFDFEFKDLLGNVC